jgi:hypothetical protein
MAQDALQAEIEATQDAITKWHRIYGNIRDVLLEYVGVARSNSSGYPVAVAYTEAKVLGHTHLGPQAVWYGQDYAKIIIGFDEVISGFEDAVLPLVFKPGLTPDPAQQPSMVTVASPFAIPIPTYLFARKGKWVFYVTSPPKANKYGVVQWGMIDTGEEGSGGVVPIDDVKSWIEKGVGLWLGPKELVTIANLYEMSKLLTIAQNFPEMFRLDFGIKPGDIID